MNDKPECWYDGSGKYELHPEGTAAEIDRLRTVCSEAYQMAGALDAPVPVLDNLSAAANGRPLPHETFLPVETPDLLAEIDRLRTELTDLTAGEDQQLGAYYLVDEKTLREMEELRTDAEKWRRFSEGMEGEG
ncbi:MAG: hypothetical protein OEY97_07695 [Nitrospirota bacterium]|nr:hypothetical protein [Nitrospirota bacterium]